MKITYDKNSKVSKFFNLFEKLIEEIPKMIPDLKS